MTDWEEYRFVSKDGTKATPWKPMPKGGVVGRMREAAGLGEGFSGQFRRKASDVCLGERGAAAADADGVAGAQLQRTEICADQISQADAAEVAPHGAPHRRVARGTRS